MIPVRPWQATKPCNCTTTDKCTCGEFAGTSVRYADCPVHCPRPAASATTTDRDAEIARMEAAPHAPESLRERVARALWEAEHNVWPWDGNQTHGDRLRDSYRRLADAALAVVTTPATQGHPDSPRNAPTTTSEGWRAPATSTLTGQDQS